MPTKEELAKELRNFRGRRTLQSNLWTLADLKDDFKKQRQDDYSDVASMAVGTGIKLIAPLLQSHGAALDLLAKAKDFLADKAKESIAGHIVDISLQPAKPMSKAKEELVTELGTTVIMGALVTLTTGAFPPVLVPGALFTIIIYLHKSEKERQEKADDKLAEKLWETWNNVREKSQTKVDELNAKEIEAFLLSSWAQDKFDEETLLKYQHNDAVLSVKVPNCVRLLEFVSPKGPYHLPSLLHAAQAFPAFGIIPKADGGFELGSTTKEKVRDWLYQLVKAEDEKKAKMERRLMAGDEILEEDLDLDVQAQHVNRFK